MSRIYECSCDQCGYSKEFFLGTGMLYHTTYDETVRKMKAGEYGVQGKEFFEKYPRGAISIDEILIQCDDCGELASVPKLSMHIPKDGYKPLTYEEYYDLVEKLDKMPPKKKSIFDILKGSRRKRRLSDIEWLKINLEPAVDLMKLELMYDEIGQYNHHCPKCGGNKTTAYDLESDFDDKYENITNIKCPKCKSQLSVEAIGHWD